MKDVGLSARLQRGHKYVPVRRLTLSSSSALPQVPVLYRTPPRTGLDVSDPRVFIGVCHLLSFTLYISQRACWSNPVIQHTNALSFIALSLSLLRKHTHCTHTNTHKQTLKHICKLTASRIFFFFCIVFDIL